MPKLSFSALPIAAMRRPASNLATSPSGPGAVRSPRYRDAISARTWLWRFEASQLRQPTGRRSASYEASRPTETTQHSGELPTEVASIANPGIHAVAAGRDVLVRRIPSQKHPTQSIALGHH